MMQKIGSFLCLIVICLSLNANSETIKAGAWRFELKTVHADIPFIIDFHWNKKRLQGTLHNGKESIPLKDVIYSQDKVIIPLQTYEITMELKLESKDILTGELIRHNKSPKIKTPLIGKFGQKERFLGPKDKATIDLSGRWALTMTNEDGSLTHAIGVFQQNGNDLHGSILTPTGDYRYMEGFVSGNKFEAASFDGVFNYLLKGQVSDRKIEATLQDNQETKIIGKFDPKIELPDAYEQTQVQPQALQFSFPDLKNKKVSLSDPKFKNKAVIIQIFGSWCPNCMDEMNFLIPWYRENQKRGIEIIALAFERSTSLVEANKQLLKVKNKKQVPYQILLAGATAGDKPMDKIPGLKNFISFPTTVFLNKNHEVIRVHAGFTGPGTGEFFDKWKLEFDQLVQKILK